MDLHNIKEDKVKELTNKIMHDDQVYCTCDQCKMDVMAITLNNIEPKYVVSDKGDLYGRADMLTTQFDADIVKEITKSIDIVAKNPRH